MLLAKCLPLLYPLINLLFFVLQLDLSVYQSNNANISDSFFLVFHFRYLYYFFYFLKHWCGKKKDYSCVLTEKIKITINCINTLSDNQIILISDHLTIKETQSTYNDLHWHWMISIVIGSLSHQHNFTHHINNNNSWCHWPTLEYSCSSYSEPRNWWLLERIVQVTIFSILFLVWCDAFHGQSEKTSAYKSCNCNKYIYLCIIWNFEHTFWNCFVHFFYKSSSKG